MAENEKLQSVDDLIQVLATLDPGAKRYAFSEALKPTETEDALDITRSVTLDTLRTIVWDEMDYLEGQRLGERIAQFVSDATQTLPQNTQYQVLDRIQRNLGLTSHDPEEMAQQMAFQLQTMAEQRTNRVVIAFIAVFILITIALLGAVVWKPDSAQYVVTVFTSVLGALAGFISGRSSSPPGTLPGVPSQQAALPIARSGEPPP